MYSQTASVRIILVCCLQIIGISVSFAVTLYPSVNRKKKYIRSFVESNQPSHLSLFTCQTGTISSVQVHFRHLSASNSEHAVDRCESSLGSKHSQSNHLRSVVERTAVQSVGRSTYRRRRHVMFEVPIQSLVQTARSKSNSFEQTDVGVAREAPKKAND